MGSLRFVVLVPLAACADISGLNGLEVGDADSDGAEQEAGSDGNVEAASTDAADAADAAVSFCTSQTQKWLWCADFDEGDVTQGFLNGKVAAWTGVSTTLPNLVTTSSSAPASAHFDGGKLQSLTFSHPPSISLPFEVAAQLQMTTAATSGDTTLLLIQLTGSYGIKLVANGGSSTGYALSFNETLLTDAGVQVTAHSASVYALNTWVLIDVAIVQNTVSITAGSFKSSFTHTAQTTPLISTMFGVDTQGWAGDWDSVRVSF